MNDTSTDHMSCLSQRLRGLTHFRKSADEIEALADERDDLAEKLEQLRLRVAELEEEIEFMWEAAAGASL